MKAWSMPALLVGLTPLALAQTSISAVLNGASYSALLSPGCWAVAFGDKLAANTETAASVPLPHTLAGVSVTVDGIAAPLLYVSPTQINFLIPFDAALPSRFGKPSEVVVRNQDSQSYPYAIQLSRVAPALFTRDASGKGPALLFDSQFSPMRTVAAGDTAIFYAAGLGSTNPPAPSDTGAPAAGPPLRTTEAIEIYVGEQRLTQDQILFVGLAPGFPGIYQINVRIPSGFATDRLYLKAGGWQSNIADFGIVPGDNVANVAGSIVGLYPPSPPNTAPYNLPPQPWGETSIALQAAAFTVSFDMLQGAKPFAVAAVGEAGSTIIRVDPLLGGWQGTSTVPSAATRAGDFSVALPDLILLDTVTCRSGAWCDPFPNNQIPISRLDPVALMAEKLVPLPQELAPNSLVGSWSSDGTASAGSRINISVPDDMRFGGWMRIPWGPFPTHTSTLKLYVDGSLIASQDATYKLAYRSTTPIYWTDASMGKIQRMNVEPTGGPTSSIVDVITTGRAPQAVALDLTRGKLYWSEADGGKVRRANLDGSSVQDLVSSAGPVALALDVAAGKLYWSDALASGKIKRANLDGSAVEVLVSSLDDREGMALDLFRHKMYWTSRTYNKIQRSNLDGSVQEDLVTTGLLDPRAIALDTGTGKMYWADAITNKIQRANLDGSGVEDVVSGLRTPVGIALHLAAGKIYWTELEGHRIRRCNLDGSGVEDIVTGLVLPAGVTLALP